MLPANPKSSEIIWNFTPYEDNRRVTLRQNPHFYMGLPTSADAYGSGFSKDSPKDFPVKPNDTIYVLVDKSGPGCMNLEAETGNRTFGNVWMPKEVMIFKGTSQYLSLHMTCQRFLADIRRKLESDELVGKDIHGPLELCQRHESHGPWTRIQGSDMPGWKQVVREALNSPNISVRVVTEAQVRRESTSLRTSASPKERLLVHRICTPRTFPVRNFPCPRWHPYLLRHMSGLTIGKCLQHMHMLRALIKFGLTQIH
jgi:hypothetical protein